MPAASLLLEYAWEASASDLHTGCLAPWPSAFLGLAASPLSLCLSVPSCVRLSLASTFETVAPVSTPGLSILPPLSRFPPQHSPPMWFFARLSSVSPRRDGSSRKVVTSVNLVRGKLLEQRLARNSRCRPYMLY